MTEKLETMVACEQCGGPIWNLKSSEHDANRAALHADCYDQRFNADDTQEAPRNWIDQ